MIRSNCVQRLRFFVRYFVIPTSLPSRLYRLHVQGIIAREACALHPLDQPVIESQLSPDNGRKAFNLRRLQVFVRHACTIPAGGLRGNVEARGLVQRSTDGLRRVATMTTLLSS
jgi:hypothetical protein